MTDFLNSLKADLLDKRVLPALLGLGVALLATLAYAVLGGGSSTGAPPTGGSSPTPFTSPSGIVISQSPTSSDQPVAETTSGSSRQRGGLARNPFTPLPGPKSTAVTAAKASSPSTTATSGSSTTSAHPSAPSQGAGGTTPAPAPKPSPPAKPTTPAKVYHLAVLFGVAPTGTPPQGSQLTPYENLKRLTPLPSAKQPLVVFRGVTSGGKSATFTLVGEAILHGNAACRPSASQCQVIELKPGQAEQLEYLPPDGKAITYQLQVVSISSSKASTASAQHAFRRESTAGRELLRRAGLMTLPGLRYSRDKGVLVLAGPFAVRAHAAVRRHHKH